MSSPAVHLPGRWQLAGVRGTVELRQFWRERDAVVFIFALPIALLGIFSAVFDSDPMGVGEASMNFPQYFLPGMVAAGAVLTSFQSVATTIAVERDDGTLHRLRCTPLPASAYIGGKVAVVLVVSLAQAVLLLAVAALLFDVPLPTDPTRWLTFTWVYALGVATGAVCGVAFSSVPRSGRSATTVVTPVVLVLQFISGVFFPFYLLPTWMQHVASVFPLKWVAQGMRSALLPPQAVALEASGSWMHGLTAAVLGTWLILGFAVSTRTFRWRRRDDG
jgi:ABC-2 type transport system permease protein